MLLSIGSGPGIIETDVHRMREDITVITLDCNPNMTKRIPLSLQPVLADGQHLPFSFNIFDMVVCITSLEFMKHPEETIKQIVDILKPKGILLALMLNPDSTYVQQKMQTSNSYIGTHLKQQSLDQITDAANHLFRKITSDHDLKKDFDENKEESLFIKHRLKILKAIK